MSPALCYVIITICSIVLIDLIYFVYMAYVYLLQCVIIHRCTQSLRQELPWFLRLHLQHNKETGRSVVFLWHKLHQRHNTQSCQHHLSLPREIRHLLQQQNWQTQDEISPFSRLNGDWMVAERRLNDDGKSGFQSHFSHHSVTIQSTEWQAHFSDLSVSLFFEK